MSLLSLEPALRPRSAFEVMQRLRAIAGLAQRRAAGVSQAYLSTPAWSAATTRSRRSARRIAARAARARRRAAGRGRGRARPLARCSTRACSRPSCSARVVLRAGASGARRAAGGRAQRWPSSCSSALPEAALRARARRTRAIVFELRREPDAAAATASARARAATPARATPAAQLELQTRSRSGCCASRASSAVLIAVDDVDRVDEPSRRAAGGARARAPRASAVAGALTASRARREHAPRSTCWREQCRALPLAPLDARRDRGAAELGVRRRAEPGAAGRAHPRASRAASPRECMELAQHLVERGVIALRGRQLDAARALDAERPAAQRRGRVRRASPRSTPRARRLAQLHALASFERLRRATTTRCSTPARAAGAVDAALDALVAARGAALRRAHATRSRNRAVRDALRASVPARRARRAPRARSRELYQRDSRPRIAAPHTGSTAGAAERAPRPAAAQRSAQSTDRATCAQRASMPLAELGALIERALDAAERARRSRARAARAAALAARAVGRGEDRILTAQGAGLLAQLERDSGLAYYREPSDVADPCSG